MGSLYQEEGRPARPWATFAILALCLGDFAWMVASGGRAGLPGRILNPGVSDILRAGGDLSSLALAGEPWRLLTSAFVHVGLFHLAVNLSVLWRTGPFVERLLGSACFVVVYLASALSGSFLSVAMRPGIVTAGASGALFGIFGALLAYALFNPGEIPPPMRRSLLRNVLGCIVLNLAIGLLPGIDNWCHAGGLAGGFLFTSAGILLSREKGRWRRPRTIHAAQLAALLAAATAAAYSGVCALHPFPQVLLQFDRIGASFADEGTSSSDEELFFHLNRLDEEVLAPQAALLESVPEQRLDEREKTMRANLLEALRLRREAVRLHRKMLAENDPSRMAEVMSLYQKAVHQESIVTESSDAGGGTPE